MLQHDARPVLDPNDAREARARLGVLTAALLEEAHGLCVDAMSGPEASDRLTHLLADTTTLAAAMAVLDRRGEAT